METIDSNLSSAIFEDLRALTFSLATFTFHLTAREKIELPAYKGSAFRGGFGHVMKRVCCLKPGACKDKCQLPAACAYAYVFETPQTGSQNAVIQATNLPHPFIILPPVTSREVIHSGEALSFQLTLIGKGIDFLPYFIYAFDELGKAGIGRGRGTYRLKGVTDSATDREIYSDNTGTLTKNFTTRRFSDFLTEVEEWNPRQITLEFITPTRITDRNRLTDKLPFDLLMRNILRRGSLLAKIHCGTEWQLDYGTILQQARRVQITAGDLRWQDWERYSNRQKRRMKLGGILGKVSYSGDLAPFLSFILLGQHIHIGKNTTFGMGKYVVRL